MRPEAIPKGAEAVIWEGADSTFFFQWSAKKFNPRQKLSDTFDREQQNVSHLERIGERP